MADESASVPPPSLLSVSTFTSSRRSSVSSVVAENTRAANFESMRRDVEDMKEMVRRLYKQIDGYDAKRHELGQDLENLKRANKDYGLKVKDLLDIFNNPPHVRVYSETSNHRKIDRLGTHTYSYGSTRSSRSSSRSGFRDGADVFHDAGSDDDDLSDAANYDERNFTTSIENFEMEDSSEA